MSKHKKTHALSEIRVGHDGQIFAHNLTPALAAVLTELNPDDDMMRARAGGIKMRKEKITIKIKNKSRMKRQEKTDGPVSGESGDAMRTS